MTRIRFQGRDRRDLARTGVAVVDSPAMWVKSKYRAGWRALIVFSDDEQVGGISDDPRRIWWGIQ
jgi:hypothetical protein